MRPSVRCGQRYLLVGVTWVGRLVEEALITDGNKVVLVDGLDERRDILDPVRDRGCGASAGGCPGSVSLVRLEN